MKTTVDIMRVAAYDRHDRNLLVYARRLKAGGHLCRQNAGAHFLLSITILLHTVLLCRG
jgi:hypothetical protein